MRSTKCLLLALAALSASLNAAPCMAGEGDSRSAAARQLLLPPDPAWLRGVQPGMQSLKVSYVGPAGEGLTDLWSQIGSQGWMLVACSTPYMYACNRVIASGPPMMQVDDKPPLVLSDWYRVPMPSAVGRVYLWPCVPGARYAVWVGARCFQGTVRLDPRARLRVQ